MQRQRHIAALRRRGRELFGTVLDLAAPARCAACGVLDAGPLCAPCRHVLDRIRAPVCERCGVPLELTDARQAQQRCDDAVRHAALAHIALARAPFFYAGSGGALVRRLKFRHDRAAARVLASAMVAAIEGWVRRRARRAVVVPVPLSRRRRRQRGLDQAAVLASAIATPLGLETGIGVLRRVRDTLPQGDPRVTDRERNLAGAFVLPRARRVRGRVVILVDDVLTSGSTARACARLLRTAGCAQVAVVTACRARH